MKLEIKKIRFDELEAFINSKSFRDNNIIPISPVRAKSYLANPNAQGDDVVLYLGLIRNNIVAFRSLFAGVVNTGETLSRFGWCSGAWVHPQYRRQGYSETLLREAWTDWNKKLMFTNYTPQSEALILKSGLFTKLYWFKGARVYLFPKTRKLRPEVAKNKSLSLLLSAVDFAISQYSAFRLLFFRKKNNKALTFSCSDFPDDECYRIADPAKLYFNRGAEELRWIFNHPWISKEITGLEEKYPFTSYCKSFYYRTVKIFEKKRLLGFFIFSIRDGYLKTLYFNVPDYLDSEIAIFLKNYCKTHKIERLTTYKNSLADHLFRRNFPFLYPKKYGQKIYSTFEVPLSWELKFQDGDGDLFFT